MQQLSAQKIRKKKKQSKGRVRISFTTGHFRFNKTLLEKLNVTPKDTNEFGIGIWIDSTKRVFLSKGKLDGDAWRFSIKKDGCGVFCSMPLMRHLMDTLSIAKNGQTGVTLLYEEMVVKDGQKMAKCSRPVYGKKVEGSQKTDEQK